MSIRIAGVAPRRTRSQSLHRRHRPQERVARLVAAAGTSFAANGYTHSRVQDMCKEAGVSVGTFYQHFEDKADLLTHLIDLATDELQLPDLSSRLTFERQLAALVRSPEVKVWRAWREALLAEPKLCEHAGRVRAAHQQRLESHIRAARSSRPAKKWWVDDRTAAWLTLAAIRELVVIEDPAPVSQSMNIARALWRVITDPAE